VPSLFPEHEDKAKPAAEWLTAFCDGGARGNPGPAGYGAVVRNAQDETLAELSEFLGVRTNNYAEYAGLLAVLAWALEHNHTHLRVVSDSLLMVNQMQGKFKVASPDLRPLWEEARRRAGKLQGFQISHALRHKNKDADRLANEAMDRGTGRPAAGRPVPAAKSTSPAAPASGKMPAAGKMLRGFTRDGVVHLLGGATLPDGVFVKILPE
jgi:probable phosphoglycerate mutase